MFSIAYGHQQIYRVGKLWFIQNLGIPQRKDPTDQLADDEYFHAICPFLTWIYQTKMIAISSQE